VNATTELDHFTGKERDAETGLDYFGARYFSAAQGRFTSPDWSENPRPIPYADLTDPQTLNLYGYVRNNPLSKADPDGHLGCGFLWLGKCPEPPSQPSPPPLPPAPVNPVYPTPDTAAVAAARMNQQQQKQTGYEYASSVFTIGPAYTFTKGVTQRKKNTVDPNNTTGYYSPRTAPLDKPPIPAGTQLVAETHSHPDNNGFSGEDVDRTHLLTLPVLGHPLFQGTYVGQPNGTVIKWDPFQSRQILFLPNEPE
jgi:RHS repeat-associated protein